MTGLMTGLPAEPWDALARELDRWAEAGRRATLWWRDDDCIEPSPALDRLLDTAGASGTPLALAVVPARAVDTLPARLAAGPAPVIVLQHGYAHRNHAPADRKKQELDPDRDLAAVSEELMRGAARLAALFPDDGPVRRLPVLVPPWNRIDPRLTARLGALDYTGLSTDGPRPAPEAAPGVVLANTHADLLRARRRAGAVDPAQVIGDLAAHLAARREGRADPAEPSGLLTHHLAHDASAWSLLETLLPALRDHPAAVFLDAAEIFAPPARDAGASQPEGAAA